MSDEQKPEDPKKPINFWDYVEFTDGIHLDYATGHFVQQTGREIVLVLHKFDPPKTKNTGIVKVALSPFHALELIHNLQSQLALLKKSQENPPEEDPPKRK